MRILNTISLMALIVLLGCIPPTATVDSNIRSGYKKSIQSIYIHSSITASGSTEFMLDLLKNLEAKFSAVSIKSKSHVRNPLSLDEAAEIKTDMEILKPATIMYLVQTSKTQLSGAGGSWGGATFEISLHETGEEIPYWKAVVETQTPNASWSTSFGGFGSSKKVGDPLLTANTIFEKLQSDGLIQVNPAK